MSQDTPSQSSGASPSRRQRRGGSGAPEGPVREPMPSGYWPIWFTVLIDMIGFGIALPVLGIYAKDRFGASGFEVGLLTSAYSAAQFAFAPLLGRLSDRVGRKPLLLFSLLGTAFAATMTAFAGSIWLLVLWRFVDGSTGASYGTATAAIGDLAPPHRRSQLIGMLGAAFGVGFTIGPAIGSGLSWAFGARAPFLALAIVSLLNALVVLVRVKETKSLAVAQAAELDESGERSSLAKTWREAGLPALLAVVALTGFAFTAFEALFSAFGRDRLGLTKNSAGFALAAVGIVSTIVQGGLIGPVSKKVSSISLLRFGGIGTAVGLAMFGMASGWGSLIPAVVVIAAAFGFMQPSLSAEYANRIDPLRRGALTGVSQSIGSGANIVGPLVLGLVYDRVSNRAPFYVGAALFVVAVALTVGARRTQTAALA
jgi:MFS transporter, DHA1 family, tetracycline resistance protein